MSRHLTGNIQAATGVTIAIRDTESFQREDEGKRSGTVSRLSRSKASSAVRGRNGEQRGQGKGFGVWLNRSEGFVGAGG
jgi:hypothetical protein